MKTRTISTTVTNSVTLGVDNYGNTLTITASGAIEPGAVGATALFGPPTLASPKILNLGTVIGGPGAGGTGGIGVEMGAGGVLHNLGAIAGGYGGVSAAGAGGGGAAIAFNLRGTLTNAGTIVGGDAGFLAGSPANGNGGGGGVLFAADGVVANTGDILGGNATYESFGAGGTAIAFGAGGTATNSGIVTGGMGGDSKYAAGNGGIGAFFGAAGILTNSGTIAGGISGSFDDAFRALPVGGIGVDLAGGGRLFNAGTIEGGAGNYSAGRGGVGIQSALAAYVTNHGTILGGEGGNASAGGAGVDLAAGSVLVNDGSILGGNALPDYFQGPNGSGAIFEGAGVLLNHGIIHGGTGGAYPSFTGDGVIFKGYAQISNFGSVVASDGTYVAGVRLLAGGRVANYGTIDGRGSGGAGIEMAGTGQVINSGHILGGYGSIGGDGVDLADGMLTNTGSILGGTAWGIYGGPGGNGVSLAGAGTIVNGGTIVGGSNYVAYDNIAGAGVILASGGMLTNSGTITGGYCNGKGRFAAAGDGVALRNGGVLVNSGTITGGAGRGYHYAYGVFLNGGTLINSGTITGGNYFPGYFGFPGSGGPAVLCGALAAKVVFNPGAVFNGYVLGNGVNDTLELASAGAGAGTLAAGLGQQFIGFASVLVDTGADWTFAGTNTIAAGSNVDVSGAMRAAELTLSGGTLATAGIGTAAIGNLALNVPPGNVWVEKNATLSGYGAVNSTKLQDNGTIEAQRGTLTASGEIFGPGGVVIESNSTLVLGADVSTATLSFAGSGATLSMAKTAQDKTAISGFGAGDKIDLTKVTFSANTTLQFAGGLLTLTGAGQMIGTLPFAGTYDAADFALSADVQGGTDINFVQLGSTVTNTASQYRSGLVEPHYFALAGQEIGQIHFYYEMPIGRLEVR